MVPLAKLTQIPTESICSRLTNLPRKLANIKRSKPHLQICSSINEHLDLLDISCTQLDEAVGCSSTVLPIPEAMPPNLNNTMETIHPFCHLAAPGQPRKPREENLLTQAFPACPQKEVSQSISHIRS